MVYREIFSVLSFNEKKPMIECFFKVHGTFKTVRFVLHN